MLDNLSVVGSIPKLINSCFLKNKVGVVESLEVVSDFINQDILQIMKSVVYAETSI